MELMEGLVMRVLPELRDSVSTEEPMKTPRPHRIKALFHERLAILLFCCRNRKVYAILLEKQMLNQYQVERFIHT